VGNLAFEAGNASKAMAPLETFFRGLHLLERRKMAKLEKSWPPYKTCTGVLLGASFCVLESILQVELGRNILRNKGKNLFSGASFVGTS
jgi:hypothetical protein